MITLSKVKTVQATGSFPNDYGAVQDNPELPHHGQKLLYKFEYEMEDGVILTANHKTTISPFPAGTPVDYEVTKDDEKYGKSGKVKKPDSGDYKSNPSGGSKGQYGGNASFAISYAKDVLIASYTSPKEEVLVLSTDQMFALGDKIYNWMEEKKTPPNPEKVQEVIGEAAKALMEDE